MGFIQTPNHLRQDKDIAFFEKTVLKNIKLFQDLNLASYQAKKVLQKMQYEHHKAGTNVFHYGDIGEKFYLIVKG